MPRSWFSWLLFSAAAVLSLVAVIRARHAAPVPSPVVVVPNGMPLAPPVPLVPPGPPQPQQPASAPQVAAEQPVVEVVFALDTTGSMSGLLDGAKRKIWSIVDYISSGQPAPRVRVGLVAYRDRGDAYVTRFWDLSEDLDGVFQHLASLEADGGGDTPEHVARGLHDAVERTHWSAGQRVARIVYVVGDAPPHNDYDDGYDLVRIARRAAQQGIHVHGVRCGDDRETKTAFAAMARAGGGQFMSIAQSGGVATVDTPFDERLAELNRRLSATAVFGRGHAAEGRAKMAAVMAAPAATVADRVSYAAKRKVATFDQADLLVGGIGGLVGAKAEELPEELQGLDTAGRKDWAEKKTAERKQVLEEIAQVASKRDAFLHQAEKARPHADAFDDSVRRSLGESAKGVVAY